MNLRAEPLRFLRYAHGVVHLRYALCKALCIRTRQAFALHVDTATLQRLAPLLEVVLFEARCVDLLAEC